MVVGAVMEARTAAGLEVASVEDDMDARLEGKIDKEERSASRRAKVKTGRSEVQCGGQMGVSAD